MRERDRLEKSRSAREAEKAAMKRLSKGEEGAAAAAVYTSKRETKNRDSTAPASMVGNAFI